ncbi:unnamed protein product [Prorocentrum cordatum]|uniref:Uncharacterized protein n=1 Tax=Prorocentrum cordatum TaxID=2364126 RepID=A0ABN9XVS0_9DINO|nr:unnamed protein product [Polarella glacialis]
MSGGGGGGGGGGGWAWAAESARSLARRLRRERREEMGSSRAEALARRAQALRVALDAHWRIGDMLGCHFPSFGEGLAAARLLGCPGAVVQQAEEALALGNQASDLEAQVRVQACPLRGEAAPFTPASRGTVDVLLKQLGGGDRVQADGYTAESQKRMLKVKVQEEPKVVAECCHDYGSVKEAPRQMSVGLACQVVVPQKPVEICVAVECNMVEYQQWAYSSLGLPGAVLEVSAAVEEKKESEAEKIFDMVFRDGVEMAEVVQHIEAGRFDLVIMGGFFNS